MTPERQAAEKALSLHGPSSPEWRCAISRSTPCSSGRAPTVVSKICEWWPTSCRGRHGGAESVRMLVVPGSMRVRAQAETEGLANLHGRRRRMAAGELFDVPGNEPRSACAGGAVRRDVQPQFRRAAGQGRPHTPGVPGGCRSHCGAWQVVRARGLTNRLEFTLKLREGARTRMEAFDTHPVSACRCGGPMSIPTRSFLRSF